MSKLKPIIVLAILFTFLPALALRADIRLEFKDYPTDVPAKSRIVVKVIDVETSSVTIAKIAKAAATLRVPSPQTTSIISAVLISPTKKRIHSGVAVIKQAVISVQARPKVKLKLRKQRAVSIARGASAGGSTLIGVQATDIQISGTLDRSIRRAEAGAIQGSLANAPCAQNGEVSIIDQDPRVQEARQRELQICGSGGCPVDRYVAPDHSVHGTLSSNGQTTSIELQVQDAQGNTTASGSASGKANDFFKIHDQALKRLIEDLCGGVKLIVTQNSCTSSACQCCPSCPGEFWTPEMAGRAKGKVGSTIHVNFPPSTGTINCGGWSQIDCLPLLCCQRVDVSQPEWTDFSVTATLPLGTPCFCPPQPPFDFGMVAQVEDGLKYREEIRDTSCP
jgi:hypothetical protein